MAAKSGEPELEAAAASTIRKQRAEITLLLRSLSPLTKLRILTREWCHPQRAGLPFDSI